MSSIITIGIRGAINEEKIISSNEYRLISDRNIWKALGVDVISCSLCKLEEKIFNFGR